MTANMSQDDIRARGVRVNLLVLISLLTAVLVAVVSASYRADNERLNQVAAQLFEKNRSMPENIVATMEWVYSNRGFRKNRGYFIFPYLGPTPIDILERGGDCADKSRLLAALLESQGVEATLVMLFPCRECPAAHTVVEATWSGQKLALDPVYNLAFPAEGKGWHGVSDLRSDPSLLQKRLAQLTAERGSQDKIAFYRSSADGSHYGFPRTINWDKNRATRAVRELVSRFHPDPDLLYRPRWLEDPKRLILGGLLLALALQSVGLAAYFMFRRSPATSGR